ncbi:MAG TPA: hypothetical protein VN786_03735, partial [Acidimicrobiales bacterium]|nr:hypothetical protein [Acidimicrobiales bacterium]
NDDAACHDDYTVHYYDDAGSFDYDVDDADDLDGPPHDHEHLQCDLDHGGRGDHHDRLSSSAAVN